MLPRPLPSLSGSYTKAERNVPGRSDHLVPFLPSGVRINSERLFTLAHAQKMPTGVGGSTITGRRPNPKPPALPAHGFGPEGERGYDAFSSKSLNSQTSQDMPPGSPISNITRHTTTRGLASPEGQGRGENSIAGGGRAVPAVVRRRDNDSAAPAAGAAAAAAAAEPEVFLPSAGAGYDPFSSKSFVSNGSCSSMSELSLPPRTTTRGLGGGGGRVGRHGGRGGDADDADSVDGDMAPDGYSAFKPSSQTGIGGGARAAHHRVKSISSSTEGTHGGGGGGGSSGGGSAAANGGHRRQVSPAGVFGGVVDESSVVEVPAHKGSKRRSSKAKIWPVANDEAKGRAGPPPAVVDDAGSDDGGDVDVGGGSGYDGFDPQAAGEF